MKPVQTRIELIARKVKSKWGRCYDLIKFFTAPTSCADSKPTTVGTQTFETESTPDQKPKYGSKLLLISFGNFLTIFFNGLYSNQQYHLKELVRNKISKLYRAILRSQERTSNCSTSVFQVPEANNNIKAYTEIFQGETIVSRNKSCICQVSTKNTDYQNFTLASYSSCRCHSISKLSLNPINKDHNFMKIPYMQAYKQ